LQGSPPNGAALAGELTPLFSALLRAGGTSAEWRGLTSTQRLILFELHDSGPLRLGALAERAGVTDPTTSRAVDGLVAAKLVVRRTDPDDRRAVLHEVTRRGRGLAEARRGEIVALLDRALDGFGSAERSKLVALLGKLNAELGAVDVRPARLPASR
jgi:DNA-binding MarR family transcriptional regulator